MGSINKMGDRRKKRKINTNSKHNIALTNQYASLKEKGKQSTIDDHYPTNDAREYLSQYRFAFVKCIEVVGLDSFRKMCEAIGCYGAGLIPPIRYEIAGPLLKKEVAHLTGKLCDVKKSWVTYGWTNKKARNIMDVLANCSLGTMFLHSYNYSEANQTEEYVCKLVHDAIEEVGAPNVVQVVTNSSPINRAAAELLKQRMPHIPWSQCLAHCIDLMLEGIIKQLKVKETREEAEAIIVFIYSHHNALNMLRQSTKGKELIQRGVTRSVTTFLCLESLHENKRPFDEDVQLGGAGSMQVGYGTCRHTSAHNCGKQCLFECSQLLPRCHDTAGEGLPSDRDRREPKYSLYLQCYRGGQNGNCH